MVGIHDGRDADACIRRRLFEVGAFFRSPKCRNFNAFESKNPSPGEFVFWLFARQEAVVDTFLHDCHLVVWLVYYYKE